MVIYEEEEAIKLVIFYIIYTCGYFAVSLVVLIYSGGMYLVGKYSFKSFLSMLVLAESIKYFVSHSFYSDSYFNLNRSRGLEKRKLTLIYKVFAFSKIKEFCIIAFTTSLMTIVYFLISVLYGAELFAKHEESLMFCSLLSILTIFPICMNIGSHNLYSLLVGNKVSNKLESLLVQNLYFTLVGAWFGAMVTPLDWDRPWQEWPIPCSFGSMLGFLVSHIFMFKRLTDKIERKQKA